MKLNFIKEKGLLDLKINLKINLDKERYFSNNSWLYEYFNNEKWEQESSMEFTPPYLINGDDPNEDVNNAILLYESLKQITPSQASEERLWSYLTHTVFWDYMRSRWPVEKASGDKMRFIKNYYFFGSSPYTLNGLARLWWPVHATVDKNREDQYELTRYLFTNQIIFRELFKRSFTRNTNVLKVILSTLIELNWKPKRDDILELTTRLNQQGGIVILDLLSISDLQEIIKSIVKEIESNKQITVLQ